jgi:hypothetical protein
MPSNSVSEITERVASVVRVCVFLAVTFIWAVVGFVFWVPLLVRMIAVFATAVLVAALNNTDTTRAQHGLDKAVRFYFDGFERAAQILHPPQHTASYQSQLYPFHTESGILVLGRNLLLSAIFWVSVVLFWKLMTHGAHDVFHSVRHFIRVLVWKLR